MPPEVEVHEITPERVADYFELFDAAFRDNPEWGAVIAPTMTPLPGKPFRPAEDALRHRADREARLRSGTARGLFAYAGRSPVGWCNVAPRSQIPNLRRYAEVGDPAANPAAIMCFVIDPAWRARGVATALVGGAIAASRHWAATWLEAYPPRTPTTSRACQKGCRVTRPTPRAR